jgi:hypothetical protein
MKASSLTLFEHARRQKLKAEGFDKIAQLLDWHAPEPERRVKQVVDQTLRQCAAVGPPPDYYRDGNQQDFRP